MAEVDASSEALHDALAALRAEWQAFVPLGLKDNVALLIIDMQENWAGPLQASGDPQLERTIDAHRRLLSAARSVKMPIFHVAFLLDSVEDGSDLWQYRHPEALKDALRTGRRCDFLDVVAPEFGETIIEKRHASAFYGTNLEEVLRRRGIDSLIATGATTSGCLRATVVDANARNFRVAVVEEAAFDQRYISVQAALYDLADRYSDVISLDGGLRAIERWAE